MVSKHFSYLLRSEEESGGNFPNSRVKSRGIYQNIREGLSEMKDPNQGQTSAEKVFSDKLGREVRNVEAIENGEHVEIKFEKGELTRKAGPFHFPPIPEFVIGIIRDGELFPHAKKILANQTEK